jgi:hypothetical protein
VNAKRPSVGSPINLHRPLVEARGVSLYALWPADLAPRGAPVANADCLIMHTRAGLWSATYLAWKPSHEGEETPWLSIDQVAPVINDLRLRIAQLAADDATDPTSSPSTAPSYLIVHVRELRMSVARARATQTSVAAAGRATPLFLTTDLMTSLAQWRGRLEKSHLAGVAICRRVVALSRRQAPDTTAPEGAAATRSLFAVMRQQRWRRATATWQKPHKAPVGRAATDPSVVAAQQRALGQVLHEIGVEILDPESGWGPAYFDHFDRAQKRRGWIVIAPTLALVAGTGSDQVETLATLIQARDTRLNGSGLLAERFEAVQGRVAQWNSTQDVYEAVSQLETLIEGGRWTTDGQLWLNFALAALGVLLALYAGPHLGYVKLAPLLLLVLASVLHARYARTGTLGFQWLAWALWALAFVAAVIALLPVAGAHG